MYDQVLVDEAQDFEKEWWELIQDPLLLKDGNHGKLCVFYDPDQNFRQYFSLNGESYRNRLGLPEGMVPLNWGKNYRNTRAIANYIYDSVAIEASPEEDAPIGELPWEEEVDEIQVVSKVKERISFYLENGNTTSQILVVGSKHLADTPLSKVKSPTFIESSIPGGKDQVRYLGSGQVKRTRGRLCDCHRLRTSD